MSEQCKLSANVICEILRAYLYRKAGQPRMKRFAGPVAPRNAS